MAELVTDANFVRAETDRMFAALQARCGRRQRARPPPAPASIDHQPVIRMNRDTLYSSRRRHLGGRDAHVPDTGDRYVSVMVVNKDHYINEILHDAGDHELTTDGFDTPYVLVAAGCWSTRTTRGRRGSERPPGPVRFSAAFGPAVRMPDYDQTSLDTTRQALLELGRGLSRVRPRLRQQGGGRPGPSPARHGRRLGRPAGAGGVLPQRRPGLPVGEYELTVGDVPVDAFWSISVYNADGYFEPNDRNAYSVNSITATPNDDGSITVQLRRLRTRWAELSADHGRLELRRPAVPAAPRDPRRLLEVPAGPHVNHHAPNPARASFAPSVSRFDSSTSALTSPVTRPATRAVPPRGFGQRESCVECVRDEAVSKVVRGDVA